MYHNNIAIPPELSYGQSGTPRGHCIQKFTVYEDIKSLSNLTPMRWNILIIQKISNQKPTAGLLRHDISKKLDPMFEYISLNSVIKKYTSCLGKFG